MRDDQPQRSDSAALRNFDAPSSTSSRRRGMREAKRLVTPLTSDALLLIGLSNVDLAAIGGRTEYLRPSSRSLQSAIHNLLLTVPFVPAESDLSGRGPR